MKLHHLKPDEGSKTERTRVGRGRAGHGGKTAGRGTKGTGARKSMRLGFEGGQMPLIRRVPKRPGFTNRNRVEYAVVNVGDLAAFDKEVDPAVLKDKGIVRAGMPVKVLGEGEITKALTVRAQAFSASAKAKIEAAGGSTQVIT